MKDLGRTARYYATHPEARKKRVKQQARYNKRPDQVKYRVELNRLNRNNPKSVKGDGKDMSHKGGKVVLEDQSKNRARKSRRIKLK